LLWDKKPFIKISAFTFFHIPFVGMLNKKIFKMWNAASNAGAVASNREDVLVLFRDVSPFRTEIYLSVTAPVAGYENVTFSGTFAALVFDGPFKAVPSYIRHMQGALAESGKKAKSYFVHCAYCPDCAKKFGHNYMVLFAELQ
jgi:hypothetical protein